jgi:carboxypeptidase family protein
LQLTSDLWIARGFAPRFYLARLQLNWGVIPQRAESSVKVMTYHLLLSRLFALSLLLIVPACHRARVSLAPLPATRVQPTQAAIVGRVISSRGASPLASALVRLLTPAGQLVDSVRADNSGVFVLGPMPPGAYRLDVRMILHQRLSVMRELRAGLVDTLSVRLVYDESGAVFDCIGPERADGTRGFGSQFCRPR